MKRGYKKIFSSWGCSKITSWGLLKIILWGLFKNDVIFLGEAKIKNRTVSLMKTVQLHDQGCQKGIKAIWSHKLQ